MFDNVWFEVFIGCILTMLGLKHSLAAFLTMYALNYSLATFLTMYGLKYSVATLFDNVCFETINW